MPRPATKYMRRPQPISPKRSHPSQVSSSPRKALERSLANKPVVRPLQDSDDSDRLVVKGPGGRRGRFLPPNEIYASGGVGKGDKPGSHPTRAQRRKQMIQARQEPQQILIPASQPSPPAVKEHHAPTLPFAPSSAVRPSSTHPTPSKENSVLDGIRPRRRQHSILQSPELGQSSLSLSDSFALPDDESTPLHQPKSKPPSSTPATSRLSTSASKKRKLSSLEPEGSSNQVNSDVRPNPTIPSPEKILPPPHLSSLRESGQKQRPPTNDDDSDIMAPPQSSSSSASPSRSNPSSSTENPTTQQHHPPILTSQLQILKPTKRRKRQRATTHFNPDFDIPSDPPSNSSSPEEDSLFRPWRHKPKRNARSAKSQTVTRTQPRQKRTAEAQPPTGSRGTHTRNANPKTNRTGTTAKPKAKQNQSTRLILTPSQSRTQGNQNQSKGTKSPSQQPHPPNTRGNGDTGAVTVLSAKARRYGGSRPRSDDDDEGENRFALGSLDLQGKENELGSKVLIERSAEDAAQDLGLDKTKSKWDEIDAWSMEFEEVEVWERSSERDAR